MDSIAACCRLKRSGHYKLGFKEHTALASQTAFTLSEIEALFVLFKRVSCSIIDDYLIHKEEFLLALFNNSSKRSLFADRLFELFDLKKNGVIGFGEFVKSLSIFHPNAPEEEKISFVFRLYDLKCTGYIERDEVKDLVIALLNESNVSLSDDALEAIVEKTISDADIKGDGRIDQDEWKLLVAKYPSILNIMTVPLLKEVSIAFPSFVQDTRVHDSELLS